MVVADTESHDVNQRPGYERLNEGDAAGLGKFDNRCAKQDSKTCCPNDHDKCCQRGRQAKIGPYRPPDGHPDWQTMQYDGVRKVAGL